MSNAPTSYHFLATSFTTRNTQQHSLHQLPPPLHAASFEFLRMPFGLRNAPRIFQRFIDCVLRGLNFCCAYVDDILIASTNEEEHLQHLEEVFRRLDEHGLVVNSDKCSFGRAEVSFLGHMVHGQGVRPLQAKARAVTDYPQPRTRRQLRRFLGMVKFYRRFIPNCAEVAASLTPLTGGRNGPIEMSTEQLAAFERLKSCLAQATTLAFPSPDVQLSLMVDASKTAIGAVLNQEESDHRQPIAFFSKALQPTEQRYNTFGRELLAAYLSVPIICLWPSCHSLLGWTTNHFRATWHQIDS